MPLEVIKVLSIEDNPGDARLIRETLHEATTLGWDLPQFELIWVDTLSAGLARLDQGDVDVVLSDLDLPDSQAGDTFARLRAHAPDIPIVVLTGREDEALARHTVRASAGDYLFKREMNGSLLAHALLYALERQRAKVALQEAHQNLERRVQLRTAELEQANAQLQREIAERRRAEEKAAHIHRFQHIISTLPQPMSFVSRDYRYLAVNDVYAEFYDTEREQILGQTVADFCGQEAFEAEIQPHLDRCLAGETVHYQVRVNFPGKG